MSSYSSVHQLVENQASQMPNAIAVTYLDQQLSYRQLNSKANQLAHYLRSLGVGPDTLIGVCIDRSPNMVIALLAVLKAGGAYVPLDPAFPSERLAFMVEDSRLSVLLTQESLLDLLSPQSVKIVCLDHDWEAIAQEAEENPETQVVPENLAYVIYTSGSTGRPKGVVMPHTALVNLLHWQRQELQVISGTRTLQFTPISFDVSFQEIFSTLIDGGTLVLINDLQRRDPNQLLEFLQSEQIQRLFLPYVALRQLAETSMRTGLIPDKLQDVITAGEQLRITSEIMQWFERMPHCRLHNHYGPSESHVVTAYTLEGVPSSWPALPAIGRPILNTQIHILDAELKPIPSGMTGELYIGGACLAREYLHRPDLTAERFILHSLSEDTISRLYRTGDMARYLDDGNIEYRGRSDQQIKIRGYRIEPGEIEATLEQHPQVRSAVIIARDIQPGDRRFSPLGDKRLVAYIVPQVPAVTTGDFQAPFARVLRHFLKQQLPEYMIPSAFVVMDDFPLTPSGKVDRRALPLPKWTRIEEGVFVEPSTAIETQIAEVWRSYLGIDRISIHDNFFDLGGHSLLAVELIAALKEVLQVEVGLETLLESPTIIGLAKAISALIDADPSEQGKQEIIPEVKLDLAIYPEHELNGPIPSILLTGATGTLGSCMLYKLLNDTRADVYCLVRATRLEEALAKIQRAMSRYKLWDECFSYRIFPVLGDLNQPKLGLDNYTFDRLSEKIDTIYHCASWVNIVYPLQVLRPANIEGTQEIIRLASRKKVKPVHYISTVDVFSSLDESNGWLIRNISDDTAPGPLKHLYSGYAQSKLLAEQLLQSAYQRGIPVTIYRPSNIIGHARTGVWDPKSFVAMMLKGCIQMGLAPQLDAQLNLVTMDYVSKAILILSQMQMPRGKSYQLVNPKPLSWGTVTKAIVNNGYSLALLPYEAWYAQLLRMPKETSHNVLSPLVTYLSSPSFVNHLLGAFTFECQDTLELLSQQSVTCPSIDPNYLRQYFAYFIETGYWPMPQSKSSPNTFDLITS